MTQREADAMLKLFKPDEWFSSIVFAQAMGCCGLKARKFLENAKKRGLAKNEYGKWSRA